MLTSCILHVPWPVPHVQLHQLALNLSSDGLAALATIQAHHSLDQVFLLMLTVNLECHAALALQLCEQVLRGEPVVAHEGLLAILTQLHLLRIPSHYICHFRNLIVFCDIVRRDHPLRLKSSTQLQK